METLETSPSKYRECVSRMVSIESLLTAGLKHKAAKGELRQGLPVGLDYDEDDRVVMTPDEAVREAIVTVFRRFEEGAAWRHRGVQTLVRDTGASLIEPERLR